MIGLLGLSIILLISIAAIIGGVFSKTRKRRHRLALLESTQYILDKPTICEHPSAYLLTHLGLHLLRCPICSQGVKDQKIENAVDCFLKKQNMHSFWSTKRL